MDEVEYAKFIASLDLFKSTSEALTVAAERFLSKR
jgi:hypothetical protein